MLKSKIMWPLPNGNYKSIQSGDVGKDAIKKLTHTQLLTDGDIATGLVCAEAVDASIITPSGEIGVEEGARFEYDLIRPNGTGVALGYYTCTKPEQKSAHAVKITGYDDVIKLDKDLTAWLSGLSAWPYEAQTFAEMIVAECGLTLSGKLPNNGTYKIQKFVGSGVTGRMLMRWLCDIGGCFAVAGDGTIKFSWLTNQSHSFSPSGENWYYSGSLKYDDFITDEIDQVRIKLTADDVGVVYPELTDPQNPVDVVGNYLMTTKEPATLVPIAKTIYTRLRGHRYTPGRLKVPTEQAMDINPGDRIVVNTSSGKSINMLITQINRNAGVTELISTGNKSRKSPTSINNVTLGTLNSKMFEFQRSIDGFNANISEVTQTVDGQNEKITEIAATANGVKSEVSDLTGEDGRLTRLEQTAQEISITVEDINSNGIKTSTGIEFGKTGMIVSESSTGLTGQFGHMGMEVKNGSESIITSNINGTNAKNISARQFLSVGGVARFERYTRGNDHNRVALYILGGGTESVASI